MPKIARIIPDEVLEMNTCCLCDKYLTVGPIGVHPEGGNICGRCQKNPCPEPLFIQDSNLNQDLHIPYVLFAYAQNHLFPCVNRFEGCDALLLFAQVHPHEMHCVPKTSRCGCCHRYEGSGAQQMKHFKAQHAGEFYDNKTGGFQMMLRNRWVGLVKREKRLFFLEVQKSERSVEFFVRRMASDDFEFFCLLKALDGGPIKQRTLSRWERDGFYHRIDVGEPEGLKELLYCECVLRILVN